MNNSDPILNRLSIIIPVYNGGKFFHHCLLSLQKFASPQIEIIVVADGDTDGSRDLAQKFGAKVLINEISFGPATARNLGSKIASGELLFFMDADVAINEQTIPKIRQVFQQNPYLTALIGSYDDQPGASNFLSQYKNLFHHYTHQQGNEKASTFWAACGVIRREIFEKTGGFNEEYKLPSVEDIELGYRLKQAGYEIKLCKDIQVKHLKKWQVFSLLKAEIFQRAIPWTVLLLKYGNVVNDLNLNWQNRISVLLVYAILTLCLFSWWWIPSLAIILIMASVLLLINWNVYSFFYEKKGFLFALMTIPWHWFYYFYGGLGFVFGTIYGLIKNRDWPINNLPVVNSEIKARSTKLAE